jgi:cobyrinic acid a,c-diamide synthase
MGLFDGSPSSADLARQFGLPVLVVIDGSAMAQTFGALASGLAHYRDDVRVHAVAANRIGSAYHASLLRESLPPDLHWFGALPRAETLALPERHLGLVAAHEVDDIEARLDALADAWAEHATLDLPPRVTFAGASLAPVPRLLQGRRIAIARDAAFCFLYPANLDLLRDAGGELVFFSPVAGDALPDCDAVWLPGGYPELHLQALARSTELHAALHAHVDAGKPLLAECGGLLFALDELTDRAGEAAPMAALMRGRAAMQTRLVALGLQSVALPEGDLRGHTFHYAHAVIEMDALANATNPNRANAGESVYRRQRMTASFVHFYFPSNPVAAVRLFLP